MLLEVFQICIFVSSGQYNGLLRMDAWQDVDIDVDIFLPHAESDVVITVRDDSDGVTIASRDITLDVAVPDGAVVKVCLQHSIVQKYSLSPFMGSCQF